MNAPLRILMVEDSASHAKLVAAELRRSSLAAEITRVEESETMRAALRGGRWDVILCDWSLPRFDALAALKIARELQADVPFLIVSGTVGEDLAVEAMRAGANDYVLKDRLARLAPAIERELRESKARQAQRRLEARFRAIVERSAEAVTLNAEDGRILYASPAATAILGVVPDALLGARFLDHVYPDDRDAVRERMAEVRKPQVEANKQEFRVQRPDGSVCWVEATRTNRLDDADIGAVVCHFGDISERKRAEAGRREAEEALRQSEVQLRHAQKMEAVGRLAGGVAHDFNNILSVIMTYVDLALLELRSSDPLRADIEEVQRAAVRAAGLTRQLLMFSRQQVLAPKVVDLHEVLAGTQRMLERILGEDIDLVLRPPKQRGRVKVDPSLIEQVVLNLVVNARDAMPTGGQLTIETENVVLDEDYAARHLPATPGDFVLLAVSDTGTGMDAATQAHIFDPFFTTKETGKGTGLGLSIVFGIVQQSGGTVWVYSEPGRGTTFKVYLPRVDAELEGPRSVAIPATLRGTETIVLVEDEEQVRNVVVNVLRRQGYRVIVATSPAEALRTAEVDPENIDLLLTDVVMPGMSGPELARRFVALRPDTKVLCMSGYTDDSVVRHGVLEAGAAFLQKPITPGALASKLREVLDEERGPGPWGARRGS